MTTRDFTIIPAVEFLLVESAMFGFGQRMPTTGDTLRQPRFDELMRLTFCLDGYRFQVGVELRQDEHREHAVHAVHALVHGAGELDTIKDQVALGALQRAALGLRPPLFYSPYEAAVWSVVRRWH